MSIVKQKLKKGKKPKSRITNDSEKLKSMTTREALAYWLALPSKNRNPKTQKDLAKLLGVSEERLCQIKREDKFLDEVQEYRKTFFRQFTSDVIVGLSVAARCGNERAAKLFLQFIEDFKETTRHEENKTEKRTFILQLGEDRYNQLLDELAEIRKEKKKEYIEAEIIRELPCENIQPITKT